MSAPFEKRFLSSLEELGLLRPDTHLLVAVSGGCDSVVLLHLLRFRAPGVRISAAHLDHAMRPDSADDALWVAGLCRAWGVPLASERAMHVPRNEAEARQIRYRFLYDAARMVGSSHVVTAHHADDQAETILFRILRGTGLTGLAGMAPDSGSGLVRPLLPFWRQEIRRYALRNHLRWREDTSNRSLAPARNRIRHEILPLIEATVAPGARRSLVRLAAAARESERAWEGVLAAIEEPLVRQEGDDLLLARREFEEYDAALRSRILRRVLRRFGVVLDRSGTRTALQFIRQSPSGRKISLPGGIRISTEWGSARISRVAEALPDEPLEIGAVRPDDQGCGVAWIGGRQYRVSWHVTSRTGAESNTQPLPDRKIALHLDEIRFPLLLRGWQPGDRIRAAGGTKKLKKLFGERRIPRSRRASVPVLVDAGGSVLWAAGVQRARGLDPRPGQSVLVLAITDD